MFNAIHQAYLLKVEFIVSDRSRFQRAEMERCRRETLEGMKIRIISPEDLVLSKLRRAAAGGSGLQLEDVRNLIRSVPGMDRSYVEEQAAYLGVSGLLREVGW